MLVKLWAIAQERLSVPFQSFDDASSDKFRSPLFLGTCQSALSAVSAFLYLFVRQPSSQPMRQMLGLEQRQPAKAINGDAKTNGHSHGHHHSSHHRADERFSTKSLLLQYLQCSVFITSAAPFGFAALSYITYPTMVLGKSCKLVPVMIMNVLLYRRRFAPYKYLVVGLVTLGITMFMGFGHEKPGKAKANGNGGLSAYTQLIGITYLLINLAIDGATNSTQDEIFARYRVTGQQMMFWINLFCTVLTSIISVLPLPYIPVLHPSESGTELHNALEFIRTHPSVIMPLAQFALTGALGQLFIFETLQHFGSLTLVTITLTRKLFTMLLSVVVYNHTLTPGQWLGASVVFAGISVEAWVKRKDVHAKRVIQEKEKAKLKSL
ncbi:UAA transporter [Laetiporus sulphureus 93-53]|uniref:UDP-galactose transporter homolog 1 n=1 Tax=Laetiporus sulphureus 93-53 TaxID=1314785 RepID=A0A165HNS7_9APHY|nr:UAA transporter [Laetiporus sulphureus 93-53]KZT11983.1 UAA transporter [Laetiporus sulphureus 93-53]